MSADLALWIRDYGGLLVGLLLLLLAVSVLPGRVKWYVLTAGLAVLGYEAYMRAANRKMLREADAEREQLRSELARLEERRHELEGTVGELNQRLVVLNGRMVELNRERETLKVEGDGLSRRKSELDQETDQLIAESKELLQQMRSHESVLAKLSEAKHAVAQIEKLAQ